jgi:hypothetical protein
MQETNLNRRYKDKRNIYTLTTRTSTTQLWEYAWELFSIHRKSQLDKLTAFIQSQCLTVYLTRSQRACEFILSWVEKAESLDC